jgi:hypothetical protein
MKAPFSRVAYAVAFVAVAVYATSTLTGPHGVRALLESHKELQRCEDSNAALIREIASQQDTIDQIRKNPAARELLIRRKLKRVRPDERVFILRPN